MTHNTVVHVYNVDIGQWTKFLLRANAVFLPYLTADLCQGDGTLHELSIYFENQVVSFFISGFCREYELSN
jgi:hypothetical protein